MDHHCPWVNNCIGEDNQKYFILFTMYTCIISCHALYIAVYQLFAWSRTNWRDFQSPTFSIIMLSLLMLESVIFGVFTGVMFFNQMWAVGTDETYIERLKKDNRERLSWWFSVKEVFGQPFSYRWFSPFHAGPQTALEIFESECEQSQPLDEH